MIDSGLPMNLEATAQFIVALNLWAALTSNSGDGGVKGEQRTENREQREGMLAA